MSNSQIKKTNFSREFLELRKNRIKDKNYFESISFFNFPEKFTEGHDTSPGPFDSHKIFSLHFPTSDMTLKGRHDKIKHKRGVTL